MLAVIINGGKQFSDINPNSETEPSASKHGGWLEAASPRRVDNGVRGQELDRMDTGRMLARRGGDFLLVLEKVPSEGS